jgi:hypothetical protein
MRKNCINKLLEYRLSKKKGIIFLKEVKDTEGEVV